MRRAQYAIVPVKATRRATVRWRHDCPIVRRYGRLDGRLCAETYAPQGICEDKDFRIRGVQKPAKNSGGRPVCQRGDHVGDHTMCIILALLLTWAGAAGAAASPLCKDVRALGKPACSLGESAVCVVRVYCLDSKFPAVAAQLCERWTCEAVSQPPKTAPPKQ